MAARNLVEGECGGANSLMKLTSHFTQDKAYQQEALGAGHRFHHGHMTAGKSLGLTTADELVGDFLSGQNVAMAPQTFHMGSLLQEMREIEEAEIAHAPQTGPAIAELAVNSRWADEFLTAQDKMLQSDAWATEFNPAKPALSHPDIKWAAEYLDLNEHKEWADEFDKDLLDDTRWTEEFQTQTEAQVNLEKTANELLSSVADTKFSSSEFMKFVKKIGDGEITIQDNQVVNKTSDEHAEDWVQDFRTAEGAKSLVDRWEEEFSEVTPGRSDTEIWDMLQQHWEEADRNNYGHPWLTEFEQTDLHEKYKFEEDNPLLDHPHPFEEGLKCLEKGDIPNAVLFFEAAVRQSAENEQAWQYLGTSQAENEQEPAAISALKQCLQLAPSNLKAWQCLAVSYTNESLGSYACHALKSWLKHNSKYSHLIPGEFPNQPVTSSFMTSKEYDEVRDLYLKAVQMAPENEVDADCNLGVLFNLSGEFDKAVDCFSAALQVRPKDALLWNKLGATLANGNRSEEAVDAYHHALQLSPGFIRSRYNLGIACINLSAHREAVEHFLGALSMQKKSSGPQGSQSQMSSNIWTTLRMTLSLMGRSDLYGACDNTDIEALCSEFGINL